MNPYDILKSAQQDKEVDWLYLGLIFILATVVGSLIFYLSFYRMPELTLDQLPIKKQNNEIAKKDKKQCEERMSEDKAVKRYEAYSPSGDAVVYLEKAFNNDIERYVRQSAILENTATKSRIILDEKIICNREEATSFFTDVPNELDEICCTVDIDYDFFRPIEWLHNDMVVVKSFGPCYECAGEIYWNDVYNKNGGKYFTEELTKQVDYAPNEFFQDDIGWEVENICKKSNGVLSLILRKNMFGGYSYVEFDSENKMFFNQMIEKEALENDDIGDMYDLMKDCNRINNMAEIEKYFKI